MISTTEAQAPLSKRRKNRSSWAALRAANTIVANTAVNAAPQSSLSTRESQNHL